MKKHLMLWMGLLVFLIGARAFAIEDAKALLSKAEAIRNPKRSYQAQILLIDEVDGKKDERRYLIKSKDSESTLLEYLEPVSEQGTKVLLSGDDMWVALPKAAKPLRIAPKQKLVGNAAYGDVARVSFDASYDATYLRKDKFEGHEVHVLDLRAKPNRNVTYPRIEYWIDVADAKPRRALYMVDSGKVLREAIFTGYTSVLGVDRPLTMILSDSLNSKKKTTLQLEKPQEKTFPSILFERSQLK